MSSNSPNSTSRMSSVLRKRPPLVARCFNITWHIARTVANVEFGLLELIYEFWIPVERFNRAKTFYSSFAINPTFYKEFNYATHVGLDSREFYPDIRSGVISFLFGCIEPDLFNRNSFFEQSQQAFEISKLFR